MNAAPGKVVDQWIAYQEVKTEKLDKARTGMMNPEEAHERLNASYG